MALLNQYFRKISMPSIAIHSNSVWFAAYRFASKAAPTCTNAEKKREKTDIGEISSTLPLSPSSTSGHFHSIMALLSDLTRRVESLERDAGVLAQEKGKEDEMEDQLWSNQLVTNLKSQNHSKMRHIKSLIDAVEYVLEASGVPKKDEIATRTICQNVITHLKDHGILKEYVNWFYTQTRIRVKKNKEEQIERILNLHPWIVEGKLSLTNIRNSILFLDEDLKISLKYLFEEVIWENSEYVSTSSSEDLILAMFASVYQTSPEMLSFPPASDMELGFKGESTIQSETEKTRTEKTETVNIKTAEILFSNYYCPYAEGKLNLLFVAWLEKFIKL